MALLDILPEEVENSLNDIAAERALSSVPISAVIGSVLVDAAQPAATEDKPSLSTEPIRDDPAEDSAVEVTTQVDHTSVSSEIRKDSRETDPLETTPAEAEAPVRRIAFETDINAAGAFGNEWLVIENEQVYVFSPNGGTRAKLRQTVPLESIIEAKAEMHVGNGLLEVRTDIETIPLVRFSHATVGEAHAVARQITTMAKGNAPKDEKVEAKRKICPKCGRVLPEDTEVCPGCLNKRAVMLRLLHFLAPYKGLVAASLVLLMASTAVDLVPPYIGGRVIDIITPHIDKLTKNPVSPGPNSFHTMVMLIMILLSTRLGAALITYIQRRVNPWLGGRVTLDIRMSLYNKFSLLSLGYYEKRSTGSMMSRVTNDADQLWDFIAEGLPWLLNNILMLAGIGTILFVMNWQLALLMLVPAPFIYALTSWFMPRARKKWHHVWHRIAKMYSSLNSTLTGMRVVKAFAQERKEVGSFRSRNESVFAASYSANSFWAMYWPMLGFLMSMGTMIIYLFGGYKVLHGTMTAGVLIMFLGYLGQFYAPFQNFSRVVDWSTRSLTAAERVFEILDTVPDIAEAANAIAMPEIKGEVEFEDVAFTYDKAKRVLDEFTLHVKPGEMIGLVGHSGAGKSTIINLLSRFYDVTEGSIKVDGVDIRNIKQDDFRRQFGIVLQEPFLFPGTIRDNIAYAKADASIDDIMRAAKAANCHQFILKFPDGYDTQVGERGQRLSGGERQRISIARAILHDPKILILDEATASVDTETEKQIQEAITRLVRNRTTFAIAHRLSTLRHASRLVVMKDGKMVECGTHDELMTLDGEYAKLVNIQNEVNKLRAV